MTARGDRIAWFAAIGDDQRTRCDDGHLECQRCRSCACADPDEIDRSLYPAGRVRVTTDKKGRTYCRECRYQEDVLYN